MQITEINIIFTKAHDGMIGFANVVLNDQLFLGSIGIHKKLNDDGYRLTYPTKRVGELSKELFHPIRKDLNDIIEKAIFKKLEKVMSKINDRYNSY